MKPARWIIAAALFVVLWCIGAFALLPRMEQKLTRAATNALAAQNTLSGRLGRMQVRFEGQTAFLSGKVRVPQETQIIEKTVEQLVSAPTLIAAGLGARLNPVAAVKNDLEVAPYPPGWMLLASQGGKARLTGTAATDHEGRDLLHAITDKWNSQGGQAAGALGANLTDHDEVDDISATLESAPVPPAAASPRVEAWLARIGGRFEPVKLAQDDATLRDHATRIGISDDEWTSQVLPLLRDLRRDHQAALIREKETARLAALPLGHLFLAVRDQRVILAGTVGSAAIKRALLDEALKTFATLRVHDDIRVDTSRRPTSDLPPITTALLPAAGGDEGKSFHLGISGQAWQPLDWRGARDDKSWKEPLPDGLEAALLKDDNARLIDWLQGGTDPMPQLARTQPAFAVLVLFGKKALLSGQIAEPALHAQLIAAMRQTYTPGFTIDTDAFVVRGHCEASAEITHAAKSLPLPAQAPLIAIAHPGETWAILPATRDLLEPGALGKSDRLPAGIPPNLLEEAAATALEELRLHLPPKP